MKPGWRVFLSLLACGAVAATAAILWPREREPEYNGKILSEWLWVHIKASGDTTIAEMEVSAEAVRQIGTNGLPWMVRWIGSYEPGRLRLLAAKLPRPFNRLAYRAGWLRRNYALQGFRILQSAARPAVPQLTEWATDMTQRHFQRRVSALMALGEMGGGFLDIPSRVTELKDRDAAVRERATNELMGIAPEVLTNRVAR